MDKEEARKRIENLRPEYQEVLYWRCKGLPVKEIALKMHIKTSTVGARLTHIYRQLGIDTSLSQTFTDEQLVIPCEVIKEMRGDKSEEVKPLVPTPKPPITRTIPIWVFIGIIFLCLCCLVIFFVIAIWQGVLPRNPTRTPTTTPVLSKTLRLTSTPTSTPLPTETLVPSDTPTPLYTSTTTDTPTLTIVPSVTPIPTETNTQPPTETPTVTPTSNLLYSDEFDSLSSAWRVESGSPMIVNGKLTASEDTWLSIGETTWKNYIVEYEGNCSRNEFLQSNIGCKTGVRVADFANFVELKWTDYDHLWLFEKDGVETKIPDTGYRVLPNLPWHVRIIASGSEFEYYLNGSMVKSFILDGYEQGYVSFYLLKGSTIDNFKVISLP